MRAYQVTRAASPASTKIVGTQGEANDLKKSLIEEAKEAVTVTEIEVPTDKTGLLDFLNADSE